MKLDLLAFGAHPDDVEIGMGATLASHGKKGFKIGICDLTQAELSSNGTVSRRQEEASKASGILGLHERRQLTIPDRGITQEKKYIDQVVDIIREYQPRIVFAPYFEDRHPDHGHCGRLIRESVFSAGIKNYQGKKQLPNHRVEAVYYYFINGVHRPDFIVDVSHFHQIKMVALSAYESQFVPIDDRVETPLTNGYLDSVESRDRLYGKEIGAQFGEGFKSDHPIKITSF